LINMFKMVNIDPPASEQRAEIAREAIDWIIPRVQADYPGVTKTIQLLKNDGFALHTASGEVSWELRGYLTRMGIVDCFTNLYGPDLINTAKASVLFYKKMFDDSGVNAREAMVVDDTPKMLSWAEEMGAATVHVTNFIKCNNTSCQHHINQLNELPALISKLRET
ncbi:MAG: HAD-IA family hydrolase, partial [Candidatus Hodarchaeota archaeon]